MKTIAFAAITGATTYVVIKTKQHVKDNPDHPSVIELKKARVEVKASLKDLRTELKDSWNRSGTTVKFNKIVKNY